MFLEVAMMAVKSAVKVAVLQVAAMCQAVAVAVVAVAVAEWQS
jgi:hypothetical protein